jgi:hypothetical protein
VVVQAQRPRSRNSAEFGQMVGRVVWVLNEIVYGYICSMLLPFAKKAMNDTFEPLDVVATLNDLPAEKLRKGSLGTIVKVFDNHTYLVEFADLNGVMYAMPVLSKEHILKIHQEPVEAF